MDLFITAEEAAEQLGVSIATLYTYVSRRNIRSQKVPGAKKRQYWRADIDRIVGRRSTSSAFAITPGQQDSQITLVTPEGPYYRGQSALKLSETATLEDTAALLWDADRASLFTAKPTSAPPELAQLYDILKTANGADRAIAVLPFIERANPRAFDFSHAGLCRTGADVLRWYAAILAGRERPVPEPFHVQAAELVGGGDEVADLFRRLLVISADHGFGAGTYAVRAVASTGVTPYRSVLAGFAISPGRRNMLGKQEAIGRMVREFGDSPDPASVVARRIREGDDTPGFSLPPPYADGDPRAYRLIEDLARIRGDHPTLVRTRLALDYARTELDLHPGFALANGLIAEVLGLPRSAYIFALGRCAGWVAHAIEQYESGEIDPPIANYRGFLPRNG